MGVVEKTGFVRDSSARTEAVVAGVAAGSGGAGNSGKAVLL
jgi:hypothetical protein